MKGKEAVTADVNTASSALTARRTHRKAHSPQGALTTRRTHSWTVFPDPTFIRHWTTTAMTSLVTNIPQKQICVLLLKYGTSATHTLLINLRRYFSVRKYARPPQLSRLGYVGAYSVDYTQYCCLSTVYAFTHFNALWKCDDLYDRVDVDTHDWCFYVHYYL